MTRVIFIVFAATVLPCLAPAKRAAPAKVEPVTHEGIRYVAPNDDGRRAYVEAWDVRTNKKLWDLTVFTTPIDPKLEEDAQWVFIKSLCLRDGTLGITSERGKTYQIDLKTKLVTQSDLTSPPAADAAAQRHDIPKAVERALTNGALAKEYDVSSRLNPLYLEGDFNGDGKIDVAVLVKQRSTSKLWIAIIHGRTDKVAILGAGVGIEMEAMISSGWTTGRFIRKTAWRWKPVRRLRGVTGTRFSWARPKQPVR